MGDTNIENENINNILNDDTSILASKRNMHQNQIKDKYIYKSFYRDSIKNSSLYWDSIASELDWFKKWDKTIDGAFPNYKFFINGYSNVKLYGLA